MWPPPGVAIGMLGLIAILTTLFPPQKRSAKLLIIVVCAGLTVAEIAVITHHRRIAEREYEREMKGVLEHFTQIEATLGARQLALARVEATRSLPANSLKKLAFGLSSEVLQFLVNRQVGPGYCQTGSGEGSSRDEATMNEGSCERETVKMYSSTFGSRVAAIRNALAKKGLTDQELDGEYEAPVNTNSIRLIAERIGTLAEKLPR